MTHYLLNSAVLTKLLLFLLVIGMLCLSGLFLLYHIALKPETTVTSKKRMGSKATCNFFLPLGQILTSCTFNSWQVF